jgi:sugar lactone lactonase YvrE
MAGCRRTRTVFQLPNVGSWFENIAVRLSGLLLVTRLDVPQLWQINPTTGAGAALITFPAPITSLSGIAEISPDLFAINAGQQDANGTVPGSWGVYTVDVSVAAPKPKLLSNVREAALINGLAVWDGGSTLLGTDSQSGTLYSIDAKTGAYAVAARDPSMRSPPGAPLQIGINGIKTRGSYVYYTNTFGQALYRAPAAGRGVNFRLTGPVQTLASGTFTPDDIALDDIGAVYIAAQPQNSIFRSPPPPNSNRTEVVAGSIGSLDVASPTACAFGRAARDVRTLYVSTSGAQFAPVNGTIVEPSKVVAVDLLCT